METALKCGEATALLPLWSGSDLSNAEAQNIGARLDAHLAKCEGCSAQAEAYRLDHERLGALAAERAQGPAPAIMAGFADEVMAKLRVDRDQPAEDLAAPARDLLADEPEPGQVVAFPRRSSGIGVMTAAAVAAAVVLVLWISNRDDPASTPDNMADKDSGASQLDTPEPFLRTGGDVEDTRDGKRVIHFVDNAPRRFFGEGKARTRPTLLRPTPVRGDANLPKPSDLEFGNEEARPATAWGL